MSSLHEQVLADFAQRFGGPAQYVVRAPGRVNLIGEHTDYNDGFVFPLAIDRATWIALRPRPDQRVLLHSLDHDETVQFDLSGFSKNQGHWAEYPRGVAWVLREAGYPLAGWEGSTICDVPMGAGLSSSASFEMAVARAFQAVAGFEWQPVVMAKLAQRAENQWVGVNCGIMDQMVCAAGKADHAMLLDCRSLAIQHLPLPPGTVVVVLDTGTRRGLVNSAYNERRAQCEAAARYFGVPALRDVSLKQFEAQASGLDELTRRRARHVVTENERTLQAAEALRRGDATTMGMLMNASHESLRHDFEVCNDALNAMVDCAREAPGCFGARMTGAGFGGCAVALVAAEQADRFVAKVGPAYTHRTGRVPHIYVCHATDGAGLV